MKNLFKRSILIVILFTTFYSCKREHKNTSVEQPNIIFFIADDMYPEMFNTRPEGKGKNLTPNIDRLANEGVFMTNQRVVSPVCTPSRYNCLTGNYASRATNREFVEYTRKNEGQTTVQFNSFITPGKEKTIGHYLQELGYKTGFVGKNHVVESLSQIDHNQKPNLYDDPNDSVVKAELERRHKLLQEDIRNCGFDFADNLYHNNPNWLGIKALAKQRKGFIRGFALAKAKTLSGRKTITQRFISPFKGKEILGGEFPRTVVKTGVLELKKGSFKPSFGEVSISKKLATVDRGAGKIGVFETLEKGIPAKRLSKIFPAPKLGKKGQILAPTKSLFKPAKGFTDSSAAAVTGALFTRGAKAAVKGTVISTIQKPSVFFPPPTKSERDIRLTTLQPTKALIRTRAITRSRPALRSSAIQSLTPSLFTGARSTPAVATTPGQIQGSSLISTPATDITQTTTPGIFTPPVPTPTTKIPPLFVLPSRLTSSRATTPKQDQGTPFNPRFVSSLTAAAFNIFGPKPKRITGLEVRPLQKVRRR